MKKSGKTKSLKKKRIATTLKSVQNKAVKVAKSIIRDTIKKHWKGMPEFNQPDQKPFKQVIVSFANAEDMHKFSKMIGQKLLANTRSVWYPQVPNAPLMDKRWTDSKPSKNKKNDFKRVAGKSI